jgi:hypothetical protein
VILHCAVGYNDRRGVKIIEWERGLAESERDIKEHYWARVLESWRTVSIACVLTC